MVGVSFVTVVNDVSILQQQQVKETEVPYVEDQQLEEKATATETTDQENHTAHGISSKLLSKLAIPSE